MHEIAFYLNSKTDSDVIWQQLEEAGCQLLYASEESDGAQVIFGRLPLNVEASDIYKLCPGINKIEADPFDPIDWEAQWAEHGADYHDGFVHVNLTNYIRESQAEVQNLKTIKLKPGPGFGDLSHPTTRLALSLMSNVVKGKLVVDLGCGSGILALAALAMGAKKVIGIDIDTEAITHAYQNAEINGMSENIKFYLPEEFDTQFDQGKEIVVLMNMIQTEQKVAWESLKNIHANTSEIITSGILEEGAGIYLRQCSAWNWQEVDRIEEAGWLGFHFVS